jgi:uncharacterized protein (TIGR02996 family)
MSEDAFLQAIAEDPGGAAATWLVLADWLEERGDPRAELVRLQHDPHFRPDLAGRARDDRVRALLAGGVPPVSPSLVNGVGMRFALVPAGTFLMGSPPAEQGRRQDEGPQHAVTISRPFWLGACPVTQAEYQRVAGANPSHFSPKGRGKAKVRKQDTARLPVECVSWEEAVAFCEALSGLPGERAAGRAYRLPIEAEWEYACRAGATDGAPFHVGWSLSSAQANFHGGYPYGGAEKGPYLGRPCAVGSYPPNAWGLYDLHGQVWEWCEDWYGPYHDEAQADPSGPPSGDFRVLRGGSWDVLAVFCRAAYRYYLGPAYRYYRIGFRVCVRLD